MAQDLAQKSPYVDEINFIELIKILIESRKLIISTILIFTLASIIYSLSLKPEFKSSTILEIGKVQMQDNDKNLNIVSDLISDTKVQIMKNPDDTFSQNVSINSLEGNLIKLKTTSNSVEQNENILNEVISYIDERYSNIETLINNKKKISLNKKIENIKNEITYFKAKLSDQTQSQYLKIIKDLDKDTQATQTLDLLFRNSEYNDRLFSLNQNLIKLIENLDILNSKVSSKSQIIQKIKTKTIKPKIKLIISFSIFIGLITGISLVFINNFIKSFREREA
jgi:LPS O-antigen subunit length determinant protein (WzzB/FepE family)